jgi:sigma-B regulation protein RsbU (phosphoserine phosphatase)
MKNERENRAKGKLKLSTLKLNTLLEITTAINNNSSRESLFDILRNVLSRELDIGKFVLFTLESSWKIALIEGVNQQSAKSVNIDRIIESYHNIEVLSGKNALEQSEFDIIIPVFHKNSPLAYLLLADVGEEKMEISPIIKHLKFIQTLANIIVVALENKRLNQEHIKQIEVQKELDLAQRMQSLLIPQKLPNNKFIKVEAFYKPHSEIGGDYYDVVKLDQKRTAFCMADVSGKGISAALLMANFQANLRALLPLTNNLNELVVACNQKIIEAANYEKFITLFIAIYDKESKQLEYLNAGHQAAICIQKNQVKLLQTGSTVLGMFDKLPTISSDKIKIEKGDKLYCYTDGLSELSNASGEQIETEGLAKLIQSKPSISTAIKSIKKYIEASALSENKDDISFLAVDFRA